MARKYCFIEFAHALASQAINATPVANGQLFLKKAWAKSWQIIPPALSKKLPFAQKPRHQCVGMAMTQSMLAFQVPNQFHVFERPCPLDHLHPVIDRFSVSFFNGRKVRRWAFYRFFGCHICFCVVVPRL